jgi:archaellum component FlaC
MSKKSATDQPVTKKDFHSLKTEFKGLKTEFGGLKTEFKGLKSEFGGLKTEFKGLKSEFGGLKSEFKTTKKSLFSQILTLEERIEHMDEKNKKYKDEMLTGLDKVMGELQAMREEDAAGTLQIQRLREDVDNHDKRISKLESTPNL